MGITNKDGSVVPGSKRLPFVYTDVAASAWDKLAAMIGREWTQHECQPEFDRMISCLRAQNETRQRGPRSKCPRSKAGSHVHFPHRTLNGHKERGETAHALEMEDWYDAWDELYSGRKPDYEHGEPWPVVDLSGGFSSEWLDWLYERDYGGNWECTVLGACRIGRWSEIDLREFAMDFSEVFRTRLEEIFAANSRQPGTIGPTRAKPSRLKTAA